MAGRKKQTAEWAVLFFALGLQRLAVGVNAKAAMIEKRCSPVASQGWTPIANVASSEGLRG